MASRALLGGDRVLFALRKAPDVFREEVDHWFNKERVSFMGYKDSSKAKYDGGGIRGKLFNRKRLGRAGGWSPQVVGNFKGEKTDARNIQGAGLNTEMVFRVSERSKIYDGLALLEKGGTVTSSKFMPIPVFNSLAQIGITGNYHGAFKDKAESGELLPIRPKNKPGILYWFYNKNGYRLLLFVGKKSIKVKKQYDFLRTWNKRYPNVMLRGEKALDRATRLTERMIKEGALA